MWLARHNVLYNQGDQSVWHIPRLDGEVRSATSPTYGIFDYREGDAATAREVVAAGTACTVGSETETLSAAAGPSQSDSKLIDVTDASDFTEGRVYLLEEYGTREAVVIDRIDTTNHKLYAQSELSRDFTTAATISAVMLEGTFPSAEAADETEVEDGGGPYFAVWTYTIDGHEKNIAHEIWITRYALAPLIDETDIKRADPMLARTLRGDYKLTELALLATEEFVADMRSAGRDPYYEFAGTRQVACRHKALEIAYAWKGDVEKADRAAERYQSLVNSMTSGLPPKQSTRIDPVTDTAEAGTDKNYNRRFFLRS